MSAGYSESTYDDILLYTFRTVLSSQPNSIVVASPSRFPFNQPEYSSNDSNTSITQTQEHDIETNLTCEAFESSQNPTARQGMQKRLDAKRVNDAGDSVTHEAPLDWNLYYSCYNNPPLDSLHPRFESSVSHHSSPESAFNTASRLAIVCADSTQPSRQLVGQTNQDTSDGSELNKTVSERSFQESESSSTRLELSHQEVNEYLCSVSGCGRGPYSSNSALQRHIRSHNPRLACTECSQRFNTQTDLSRHWDSMHSSEKLFTCPERYCDQSHDGKKGGFKRKDGLRKHMQARHSHLTEIDLDRHIEAIEQVERRNFLATGIEISSNTFSTSQGLVRDDSSHRKKRHRHEISIDSTPKNSDTESSEDQKPAIKRLRKTIETQAKEIQTLREHLEMLRKKHETQIERLEKNHDKELERLHETLRTLTRPRN